MNSLRDMVPASVRRPAESSRFVQALHTQASRLGARLVTEVQVTEEKSGFCRMAHEPEDARLTGVTRSLERRLLALNLSGPKLDSELQDLK